MATRSEICTELDRMQKAMMVLEACDADRVPNPAFTGGVKSTPTMPEEWIIEGNAYLIELWQREHGLE